MTFVLVVPPRFTKPLKDQHVLETEDAAFDCQMTKRDIPVTWLKDGRELEVDERVEVITDGFIQELVIYESIVEDEAEYSCVCGEEKTAAKLTVEG